MKITGLFYLYFLLMIINLSQALRCGEKFNNKKCPEKQCCSYLGYCGRSREYCDPSYGCKSEFGRCSGKDSSSSISSTITTTTTTATTATTSPKPTTSKIRNCGPEYNDKLCKGDECCSKSGQCGLDIESCGAGCQKGYGFCLPDYDFNKEQCLDCEDCFNCDGSPFDRLFCSKNCFKDGNKKTKTIELVSCDMVDTASKGSPIDIEQLSTECNKYIDCTEHPDIAYSHPTTCKRVSDNISTDGTCGPQYGNKVCPGLECCDESGHCGISKEACDDGCQMGYGICIAMYYRFCVFCMDCNICDNEFDALYCPETCYMDKQKANIEKTRFKLRKFSNKLDCPSINKICYGPGNKGWDNDNYYIVNEYDDYF